MIAALPWLVAGGSELWIASTIGGVGGALLGWVGAATAWAGVAYVASRPGWLGKGRPWRWLLLPVALFSRGVAAGAQALGLPERAEVVPGLWVGAWPRRGAPGLAVVDLCAELPRRGECAAYVVVPMLDGAVPSRADWQAAVDAVGRLRRESPPVLVHCAYGHGRSVAVVIGHLVATGVEPDLDAALARVRRVRPAARLTPGQRRAVAAWLTTAPGT